MNKQAELKDGSELYFCKGSFDNFFVRIIRPDKSVYAPKDNESFEDLLRIADDACTREELWYFILGVSTGITRYARVSDYRIPDKFEKYEYIFAYFIAAMIAEENIAITKLGRRIKLLGIHQVLMGGMPTEKAADYSRGLPWREIDEECKKRGF